MYLWLKQLDLHKLFQNNKGVGIVTENERNAESSRVVTELTDFLNSAMTEEKAAFVEALLRKHRTLQQSAFDLFLDAIRAWSVLPDTHYDPRNSLAVRLSKEVVQMLDKPTDYPVENVKFPLQEEVRVGTNFNGLGYRSEMWELTQIDKVWVQEFEGVSHLVVNGRAKRIY